MAWTVEASITRQRARMAFGRYTTSLPTDVSFMMEEVTMMTSSAEPASSLMTRYTIWRSEASLFWKSFDMPKKSVVASCRPQLSPVKSSRASFVRITLHFLGDIGLWLNTRAGQSARMLPAAFTLRVDCPTFLEYRRLVDLGHAAGILVLLVHGVVLQRRLLALCDVESCPTLPPPNVAFRRVAVNVSRCRVQFVYADWSR
jgi:hypothetical protein